MPISDTRVANFSADVVAVFDANFTQVFALARPIKATVNEQQKVMEHPVEDGTVITDHKVIQPIEIELSMLLTSQNYRSVYQQIKQLYLKGTLLTVQTKAASYANMLIYNIPHDEDPTMYNSLAVGIKLRQVQFVTATFGTLPPKKVKKKTQASTVSRGEVQPKPVTDSAIIEAGKKFGVISK